MEYTVTNTIDRPSIEEIPESRNPRIIVELRAPAS
jgi:hypothetical protein